MIILANDGIDKKAKADLEKLGFEVDSNKYEGDDLLARLKEVDCVVIRSATKMRDPQIDAGAEGKLKLIIRAGVGVDNINVDHAKEKGIEVRNTPTASSNAVAELALGHMFALCRNIHRANRTMAAGAWEKKAYQGTEIAGKTLGIIGMGRIGACLAEKAKALGMTVIYHNRSSRNEAYEYVEMDELLKRSDFISLNLPKTDKPVLGKEEIAKMKDGAFIVNTARGGAVDEEALVEALDSGKLAGVALDGFVSEPTDNEKILKHDKISMTPHIGAATAEAQARIGDVIVEIVQEVLGK